MNKLQHSCLLAISSFLFAPMGWAVSVTPGELAETRRWAAAKFEGVQQPASYEAALVVLANHGVVQKNARAGQPLRLGDKEFSRGLFCHAPSKIIVRLPSPGASFSALVGLDRHGGGGSVDFSVSVGGADKFRSGVMHNGTPAKPVNVDLGGATEFVLRIEETPDGIACDQADWAEAKVTLKDGREIWVADLPFREWSRGPYSTELPFSFVYGGKPSTELLKTWKLERSLRKLDAARTERTLVWSDPQTGLQVRCIAVEYADFPTVEWTLHFKNTGTNATPMLSDVLALDTRLEKNGHGDFLLHHHKGTFIRADDFEPLTTTLKPNDKLRFAPPGGRPLGQVFPYYNLEQQAGEGVIAVVGWPGQWFAEFARDQGAGLRVIAGQEKVHLRLKPGEEIRSPLIVLQFWRGEWLRAQNIWRRWMLAHNTPRPGGKPITPMMSACNGNQYPGIITHAAEELHFLRRYLEEGIKPDYWWQDAGWYPCGEPANWSKTGTWEVEPKRWPKGIREVSDWCHAQGMKTVVWFEPERVTPGTWLTQNHPEWVLGGKGGGLLNLGDPQCRTWLVNHIDKLLVEQGIDLYRQDYNIDPLPFWRANDAEDRQGSTENHYVTGYLAYWDELLKRHPGMLIDTCASGGHRNDLETLRRAVPLLRSDYIFEPVGQQNHTYGLALWMPFFGTGPDPFKNSTNPYFFRSCMCAGSIPGWDLRRKDLDYDMLRKLTREWRQVADCFLGDYHPLTPYGTADDIWMAWQFDVPESGKGLVQVFRRKASPYEAIRLKLRGLDPAAVYTLTNLDVVGATELTGRELMNSGFSLAIKNQPEAVVITYQKKATPTQPQQTP